MGESLPNLACLFHLLAKPWAWLVGGCPLSPPHCASPSIWTAFPAVLSHRHVLAPSHAPQAASSRSLPSLGVLPGHPSAFALGVLWFLYLLALCFIKPLFCHASPLHSPPAATQLPGLPSLAVPCPGFLCCPPTPVGIQRAPPTHFLASPSHLQSCSLSGVSFPKCELPCVT